MKKVAFHNLGCKVNSYELDVMRQILREEGYAEVPFQDRADIYVVNTCSVTNIADRKSRQMLHRARKQNRDAVVIAVGCYVETDPEGVEKDRAVDLVIGNNRKSEIGQILRTFLARKEAAAPAAGPASPDPALSSAPGPASNFREDLTCSPAFEDMQLTEPGHTRAYIKIQDGCNQFCSYCIIPFARGRIRSRAKSEILREVTGLVRSGIREVVLTGIHVSSYGLDRDEDGKPVEGPVRFDPVRSGKALLDLISDLNAMEGLERIRLSSLEPRIMTEPFIEALARLDKVCPHFHLSLQSGCDETLRRMNRHYTTAEYAQSVRLLRQYYDRPAVTTDVIVGFPGETEEEFARTLAFLEEIRFYEIHVFRYSRRTGTVADRMPDQVPEPVKAERSDRLLALTAVQAEDYRRQFSGEEEEILLEEICTHAGRRYWTGSTARYVTGALALPEDMPEDIPGLPLPDTDHDGQALLEDMPPAARPQELQKPQDLQDYQGLQPGRILRGYFREEIIPFSRGPALRFEVRPDQTAGG